MSNNVTISKHNELYVRVDAENSILREISEKFSFMVPGSQYSPAFKAQFDQPLNVLYSKSISALVHANIAKEDASRIVKTAMADSLRLG